MNKLKLNILAQSIVSLLLLLLTGCGIDFQENYFINNIWFYTKNIYIHYTKSNTTDIYYLFTAHGNEIIGREKKTSLIYRFPRASDVSSKKIDLDKGEESQNLIYEDQGFKIQGNDKQAVLTVSKKNINITNCSNSIWSSQTAIRIDDKLFYCGVLYDSAGNIYKKVPQPIVNEAIGVGEKNSANKLYLPQVFKYIINDNQLSLTSSYLLSSHVFIFANWPLENGNELNWNNIQLPTTSKIIDVLNNYRAYAPYGFVLSPSVSFHWILYCEKLICKKINIKPNTEYLLFDSKQRELYIFVREYTTSPMLMAYKMNY